MGQTLLQNSQVLRIAAGIIIIVFSLQLIGFFNFSYDEHSDKIFLEVEDLKEEDMPMV